MISLWLVFICLKDVCLIVYRFGIIGAAFLLRRGYANVEEEG
jgi:hypothetical protein